MGYTSRARYLRYRNYSRVVRSGKFLAWIARESTGLGGTATADTFVTVAKQATGTLTYAANLTGAVAATETLTLTGNILDTETVRIGSKTYTFQDTLTDVDGNVHIGASAAATIVNLVAAVMLGDNPGTDYATSMTANTDATAVDGTGDTVDVTAILKGTAGNSLATQETATNGSWGASSMSGGVDGDTVTIGSDVYTYEVALTNVAGNVLLGGSASDSLDNLIAAVNGGAGSGSTYAAATVTHTGVTAAAGAGDTMDVTAILAGTDGNAIATTETGAQSSWGGAVLSGGVTSTNVTATGHGLSQGEGPYQLTTSTTLPGGLALTTDYWINVVDSNTIGFAAKDGAASVSITTEGTGTHTITKGTSSPSIFDLLRQGHSPRAIEAAADVDTLD